MQWAFDNWIWILFGVGMVAMHMFGHGGHGKSRNGACQTVRKSEPDAPSTADAGANASAASNAGKYRDL